MRSFLKLALGLSFVFSGCLLVETPSTSSQLCGGFAGIACDEGLVCADDPSDDCDPNNGGADCGGVCVEAEEPAHCGGIAGIACEFGETCVDDPSDDCDPTTTGADCGGICVPAELGCGHDGDCDAGEFCDFSQVNPVCLYDIECGTCTPDPEVKHCGGFAGIACDEGEECIDDPSDDCELTAQGGADCGGICVPAEKPGCGG
jgi:hypothetical protein